MTINLKSIDKYYTNKLKTFGDSPKAVDWKNKESQYIRMQAYDSLFCNDKNNKKPITILDYGCGKGDYFEYLQKRIKHFHYIGVDISKEMITFAKKKFQKEKNCQFFQTIEIINIPIDYSIANGTFTVCLKHKKKEWFEYIYEQIDKLYAISSKGVGFNLMTSYVDFRVPHLFYYSPSKMFNLMKKKYGHVDVIHSYPLYEYTILIRK